MPWPPSSSKTLGERTAITLMKEMRFLGKLQEKKDLNDLLDILDRKDLGFQTIAGEDAAKSSRANGYFGAELAGLRFCVADGNVERTTLIDTDHTIAFKYIHGKQEALLNYLNDPNNKGFTEGFLNASAVIDGNTINISDYFGHNPSTQKVNGTRRFFKLCYNDIDNLLLLCHACNVEKGTQESMEWFGKQEPFLGQAFIDAVKAAGGLHDGIIVKKVGNFTGDTVLIGNFNCVLHDGTAKGLGEFINDWFNNRNPEYSKGIVQTYKDIWLELKEIWELQLKAKAGNDQKTSKTTQTAANKLTEMLRSHIAAVEQHYKLPTEQQLKKVQSGSQGSGSSEDNLEARKARVMGIDKDTKKMLSYMHEVKKIQRLIGSKDPTLATSDNRDALYAYLEELNIRGQKLDAQTNIFHNIQAELNKMYNPLYSKNPTVDNIMAMMQEAVDKENPLYKQLTDTKKQLTEANIATMNAEHKAKAAERKAKAEADGRQAAEAEVARLQAQFAALSLQLATSSANNPTVLFTACSQIQPPAPDPTTKSSTQGSTGEEFSARKRSRLSSSGS